MADTSAIDRFLTRDPLSQWERDALLVMAIVSDLIARADQDRDLMREAEDGPDINIALVLTRMIVERAQELNAVLEDEHDETPPT